MIDWQGPSAERIQAMSEAGLWTDKTVLDYLDAALKERPDQVYMTDRNSMTGRSTTLTSKVSLRTFAADT